MDLILVGVQWSHCLVYLDDIIGHVFKHLYTLGVILQKLREAGLRLKTRFYLGHVISSERVTIDPDKTSRVANWPTPTSMQEVQQFSGPT